MRAIIVALCAALALSACNLPPNPDMATDANRIEAKIVRACTASGLFKPVVAIGETMLEAAVPVSVLPVALVNAGVDQVCAMPSVFAGQIGTVEWITTLLVNHLHDGE